MKKARYYYILAVLGFALLAAGAQSAKGEPKRQPHRTLPLRGLRLRYFRPKRGRTHKPPSYQENPGSCKAA